MKRKITQIRDLEIIEKELNNANSGVLAFADDKELIHQFLISFLYSEKNIYIVLSNSDEILDKLVLDGKISFIIYKNENKSGNPETQKVITVKCIGTIKKVEEQRTIEDIFSLYIKKYKLKLHEEIFSNEDKVLMIDTEEFQAAEVYVI